MHTLGPDWLNADTLLQQLGPSAFWASLVVIFVECGLFIFFMPGDSLLFTIGLAIQNPQQLVDLHVNILVACVVLTAAAFLGNVVGYEIGRAVGAPLYTRGGRLLKPEHFDKAHAFFDSTAARRSSWPASCQWSARSSRPWPASA
jgi:membrane-associated protein